MSYKEIHERYLGQGKREGRDFIYSCLFCYGKRLSANPENGLMNCHSCDFGGNIVSLLRRLGRTDREIGQELAELGIHQNKISEAKSKEIKLLDESLIEKYESNITTQELEAFANIRGFPNISLLKKYKFGKNDLGEIVFPTFGPNGELRDFRRRSNQFEEERSTKGSKLGMFGLDNIKNNDLIIWCESPLDAIASEHMGFPAVASCGAGMNCDEYLHLFEGKDVIVAFDNDGAGLKGGLKKLNQLNEIAALTIAVEIPKVHQVKDVNDLLKKQEGPEIYRALIKELLFKKPIKISKTQRMHQNIQQSKEEENNKIAKEIANEFLIIYSGNEFYAYETGVYKWRSKIWVEALVKAKLGTRSNRNRINEIRTSISLETAIDPVDLDSDENLINLRNGLFHIPSKTLYPHDCDYASTIQLRVTYDDQAICPEFINFLKTSLEDDSEKIACLQEFMGYVLMRHCKYEKVIVLFGQGANGKSVFIEIFLYLLGEDNCSALSLDMLAQKFMQAELNQVMANFSTEIQSKSVIADDTFKKAVSGEIIQAEKKGKDPFKFRPRAKFIFAANQLPRSSDLSDAIPRRLLIVPFNKSFNKVDRDINLKDKLLKELPGIFNWMLQGLERLEKQGEFTQSTEMLNLIEKFKKDNNNVLQFLEEECYFSPHAFVGKTKLHEAYKEWCSSGGSRPVTRNNFKDRLLNARSDVTESRQSVLRGWQGIGLKDNDTNDKKMTEKL